MNRFAFKLLVFLLLGAIINVAVAWTSALAFAFDPFDGRSAGQYLPAESSFSWKVQVWRQRTSEVVYSLVGSGGLGLRGPSKQSSEIPPRWVNHERFLSRSPLLEMQSVILEAHGWPFLTAHSELIRESRDGRITSETNGGIPVGRHWLWFGSPIERKLPLRPIWPGFAINTIFYAAIVWVLLAVPGYLKRRRRIKRGVCVRCAYPVGVGSVCSECGTPVHPRNATHGAAAPCNPR